MHVCVPQPTPTPLLQVILERIRLNCAEALVPQKQLSLISMDSFTLSDAPMQDQQGWLSPWVPVGLGLDWGDVIKAKVGKDNDPQSQERRCIGYFPSLRSSNT